MPFELTLFILDLIIIPIFYSHLESIVAFLSLFIFSEMQLVFYCVNFNCDYFDLPLAFIYEPEAWIHWNGICAFIRFIMYCKRDPIKMFFLSQEGHACRLMKFKENWCQFGILFNLLFNFLLIMHYTHSNYHGCLQYYPAIIIIFLLYFPDLDQKSILSRVFFHCRLIAIYYWCKIWLLQLFGIY